MKVNHTVENQDGTVTFEANLNNEELDFVIEVGLNFLLAKGVMPFASNTATNVQEPTEVIQ